MVRSNRNLFIVISRPLCTKVILITHHFCKEYVEEPLKGEADEPLIEMKEKRSCK